MANVGYATLQIIPSAKGFTTALQGQVGPGMAAAGTASSKKFGGTFLAGFKGMLAPLAAVAGTTALAGFFKSAVTGASDLNETLSKTGVIFGKATDEVVKFAEDSKRNILLTKQEALDASATFGIFGKSAGLTGTDLAGFSTKLTGLASDLSSFYNTSTDDAIVALGAALRGESEPIRRYGVLLDDASLRQEALRQGLIKTTKQALTPQQRVLAAQALILKQTSDAQGDAARTSNGLANQQRILAKNFNDIKVEIGSALLPVVTSLVQALNRGIKPAFEAIKTVGAPVIDFFKALGGGSGEASTKVGALSSTIGSLRDFLAPVAAQLAQFGSQIGSIIGPAFKSISDIITGSVLPAIRAFLPAIQPVSSFFINVLGKIVLNALRAVVGVVKGIFQVLSGLLNAFAGLFTGDWSRLWKGIKQIFSGLWTALVAVVKAAFGILWDALKAGLSAALAIVKGALELLINAIKSGLEASLRFFIDLPRNILKAVTALPKMLFNFGVNMLEGFINGIKSMASGIINAIKETITDKLPSFVKKALGIQSPSKVFAEIGRDVGLGFIKGVQGTKDQMLSVFTTLAEDIKKTGNKKLIEAVADTRKQLVGLINKRDLLRESFDAAQDHLKDLKQTAQDLLQSVSEAVQRAGSVVAEDGASSFDNIVTNLQASVEQATTFAKVIKDLRNAGLNNTALQQLVDAGPGVALASAQSILGSGSAGISQINVLQEELKKQGDSLGRTVSDAIYGPSIEGAKKAVNDIGNDLTNVENKIVETAAALAREIAKIGRIPVPDWLKNLALFTKTTVPSSVNNIDSVARSLQNSPKANAGSLENSGPAITINNYNPISEPTSVTVSNTLTRLALIGVE